MGLQTQRVVGGTTSLLARFFIGQAAAPFQGAVGLTTGAGWTFSWIRAGGTTASFSAFVAGTTGSWTSSGFVQIDGVNLPGLYEIGLPNAGITSGTTSVEFYLNGTAGICPVILHCDILPGDPYTALVTTTYVQPSAVPPAADTLANKIGWLAALARNKVTTTATTQSLFQDGSTTTISTNTVSDDGTTATRGQWS